MALAVADLDLIEKLMDIAINCVEMPNLGAIKQDCMEQLAQINAALAETQLAARAAAQKEEAEAAAKAVADAKKAEQKAPERTYA